MILLLIKPPMKHFSIALLITVSGLTDEPKVTYKWAKLKLKIISSPVSDRMILLRCTDAIA